MPEALLEKEVTTAETPMEVSLELNEEDMQEMSGGKMRKRLTDFGPRRDMANVPIDDIIVEPGHNPRDFSTKSNQDSVLEKKESIRVIGLMEPLSVRIQDGKCILVDGETRLRAMKELRDEGADITHVLCKQVQANDESMRVALALTANSGKPLEQIEIGPSCVKLFNWGWSVDKIAQTIGKTPHYVTAAIELTDAPMELKEMVRNRLVSPARVLQDIGKYGATRAIKEIRKELSRAPKQLKGKESKPITMRREVKDTPLMVAARALLKEIAPQINFKQIPVSNKAIHMLKAAVDEHDAKIAKGD